MRRIGFAVARDAALVHFARQAGLPVDATPLGPRTIRLAVNAPF